jgi:hypothetical protein
MFIRIINPLKNTFYQRKIPSNKKIFFEPKGNQTIIFPESK